ncbi:MAG: PepSY domain-containing protein [Cyanobacteria bacterium J06635_11]
MSVSSPDVVSTSPALDTPNRFYQTVWRWHFYAGLFVIPFMLVLGATGIIYLFKPQLDHAMYHNLLFVSPNGSMLPYAEQVQTAQSVYPDATVTKFIPNAATNRSADVFVTQPTGQKLEVFVDPYAGRVLGVRDEEKNLQAIARKIHGDLLIGDWGDYLIELAACWALVLLISGLYLWFPRERVSLLGTFVPRLWSQNKRIFWRDLHAVPGFYGVLLIGFLILTGLPWTGFWGDTFAQVWGRFPDKMWDNVPQSTVLTGSLNDRGELFVPWAAEQMPMPLSSRPHPLLPRPLVPNSLLPNSLSGNASMSSATTHTVAAAASTASATLVADNTLAGDPAEIFNKVVKLAIAEGAPPGFNIAFPEDETGVYTASAFPNDPTQEVTMHMDQYTGELLASVGWPDYGLVPKAVELGISIHMGKYFGLANQLIMLFAALVTILLSITGTVLWWRRRPKGLGLIGAPPMPRYQQQWRTPLLLVAGLGFLFPLVGLSLIAVLSFDYFLRSRILFFKKILG